MSQDNTPLFGGRMPPSNIQAEQALLGAILTNNKALDLCTGLEAEHFADPINGFIFKHAQRLIQEGRLVDAVTLKGVLENTGALEEVGGVKYLTQLLSAMVGILNAPDYARAIRDSFLRRKLIDIAADTANLAYGGNADMDGEAVIGEALDSLLDLGEQCGTRAATDIATGIDEAVAAADMAHKGSGPKPMLTGLQPLDALWGGMYPGSLDYLGARSMHGKTAIGMQIIRHNAEGFLVDHEETKKPIERVLFFSLEMGRADVGTRMLATESGISSDNIRAGNIGGFRAETLIKARNHLRRLPIIIQDKTGQTLGDIQSGARIGVKRKNVRLVVIDHLHRIGPTRPIERLPRGDQIAFITSALKDLARSLGVPILLLCQLVKDVERREDPRPIVPDIKFAVEADADNILLLWRPELYMPDRSPPVSDKISEEKRSEIVARYHERRMKVRGKAEIIGAKRRFGPPNQSAWLDFIGHTTTFAVPDGADVAPDLQSGLF